MLCGRAFSGASGWNAVGIGRPVSAVVTIISWINFSFVTDLISLTQSRIQPNSLKSDNHWDASCFPSVMVRALVLSQILQSMEAACCWKIQMICFVNMCHLLSVMFHTLNCYQFFVIMFVKLKNLPLQYPVILAVKKQGDSYTSGKYAEKLFKQSLFITLTALFFHLVRHSVSEF